MTFISMITKGRVRAALFLFLNFYFSVKLDFQFSARLIIFNINDGIKYGKL